MKKIYSIFLVWYVEFTTPRGPCSHYEMTEKGGRASKLLCTISSSFLFSSFSHRTFLSLCLLQFLLKYYLGLDSEFRNRFELFEENYRLVTVKSSSCLQSQFSPAKICFTSCYFPTLPAETDDSLQIITSNATTLVLRKKDTSIYAFINFINERFGESGIFS